LLFNSFTYLSFIIVVIPLYYLLPSKLKNSFLLLTSFLFYAYWDWRFCSLLIITTLTVYLCGKFIYASKEQSKKKLYLYISLIVNLGILVLFKYYNFFIDSFSSAFSVFGGNLDWLHLKLILPIGISFYTFQALTYVIDIYRGDSEPSDSIIDVSLFVTFFPQLLMGPIERARNILPQLKTERRFNRTLLKEGFVLITIGMFKKVIIGDTAGKVVNQVFADPAYYTSLELIMGIVLFTIQLYADFSGYTNIARGTAKMLGLNIMENFEQPYFSQSITEFWRRWHISLSTYLRDYLYTPLTISTRQWGIYSIAFSLFLTFVLAGLWHGAGWTFIIFGALHGAALVYEALSRKFRKKLNQKFNPFWYNKACMLLAFVFVMFTFIFFRSDTVNDAFFIMGRILNWTESEFYIRVLLIMAAYLTFSFSLDLLEIRSKTHAYLLKLDTAYMLGISSAMWMVVIPYMLQSTPMPFIYFQF
jgi:D-alanyl-lipoteichoic acid acyltransferase DltB (MBOAT superfamily)